MKKIITIAAFVAFTVGASSTAVAQRYDAHEATAKSQKFAENYKKELGLSDKQSTSLYHSMMLKLRKEASANTAEEKQDVNNVFNAALKAVLNDEQLKKYKVLKAKK